MSPARWCCTILIVLTVWQYAWTETVSPAATRGFLELSDDFDTPVSIVPDPHHPGWLLIAERSGVIVSFNPKSGTSNEVVDIEDLIGSSSPRGIMSIAPCGSDKEPRLFVSYLDPQGDLVVGRFPLAMQTTTLSEEGLTIVIKVARLTINDLGSALDCTPDGTLYIGVYDGEGPATTRTHTAQLPNTLLGKVIRIKPQDTSGYSLPADNPFRSLKNYQPEIWALGFRSPEALRIRSNTKQLVVLDSNERHHEINVVESGKNYGWDTLDGNECRLKGCAVDGFANPVLALPKAEPTSRLVGGIQLTGERYPELKSALIFAESSAGILYSAHENAAGVWQHRAIGRIPSKGAVSAMGHDHTGTLYVATTTGELFGMQ